MLSVPTYKLPRKVAIQIAKAEKISPSKKDNKKKLNTKFRVVVLGGKKKESSVLVEDLNGNPEWNFKCVLKMDRETTDPICLLVEDSEGHHKGQVIVPIVKIGPKPYTYSPDQNPATSSNLICSELEPTNKCSVASGFLIYWIWVEEFYALEDAERAGSISKSMANIFGSKNALDSKKSRLSIPKGSSSNISSTISLNKPEKHKKTLSFLHIKSKKDKSKKTALDYKVTPDSSDVESYNEPGNPFDLGISPSRPGRTSSDLHSGSYGNPFNISSDASVPEKNYNLLPDRLDRLSHGSHGSISESGSYSRNADENSAKANIFAANTVPTAQTRVTPTNSVSSIGPSTLLNKLNAPIRGDFPLEERNKETEVTQYNYERGHKENNISDYSIFSDHAETALKQYHPMVNTVPPVTLSITKTNSTMLESPTNVRQASSTMPTSMFNKFSQGSIPSSPSNQRFITGSPNKEMDYRYQQGHRSANGSDYSVLSDRSGTQPPSATMRLMNEEADLLRKENADLKNQSSKSNNKISALQSELDYVKDVLFKLRTRLLEEGATNFLEMK